MPSNEFQEVSRLAQENGIILFSDEVYRESEFREKDRLPAACDFGEHAVSLGVMSKTYGLPGLRIGWIATRNAAVYEGMAALKDYTTICNSAPSEFLAELALRHRKTLAERNLGVIADNLNVLDQFFERHAAQFSWRRPQAGSIGFPRLLGKGVEAFCEALVNSAGVLLLPGTLYGDDGNHFRIGFGRRNMPEAIGRLEQFLQQL
jgi:aspartate/methionine/tyrosine aminotransferase